MSGNFIQLATSDETGNLDLSETQKIAWRLYQSDEENPLNNFPLALFISGIIDIDKIEETVKIIFERHLVLTACFSSDENKVIQDFETNIDLDEIYEVDMPDLSDDEAESELSWSLIEAYEEPFDLQEGPLLRSEIYHLDEDRHVLLLVFPKIIFDLFSSNIMIKEFYQIYQSLSATTPISLSRNDIQYSDFISWQHQNISNGNWEEQSSYWQNFLKDLPESLELLTDRPRSDVPSSHGALQKLSISTMYLSKLNELGQELDISLSDILFACFQIVLSIYSGKLEFITGLHIPGRTKDELKNLIGNFSQQLPVKCDLTNNPTFKEILQNTQLSTKAAMDNQDIFAHLINGEQLPAELFQVLFTFLPLPDLQVDSAVDSAVVDSAANFDVSFFNFDTCQAHYDWEMLIQETNNGLDVYLNYNTDLFNSDTAEQAIEYYFALLDAISSNSEIKLNALAMTAKPKPKLEKLGSEIQPISDYIEFNRDELELSIVERFQKQVSLYAEKVAIQDRSGEITYKELDQRSNSVANHITSCDNQEVENIALLFKQEAAVLCGLLGVLKAGKTYVPLDESAPAHRLQHIMENAGVNKVITNNTCLKLAQEIARDAVIINIDDIDDHSIDGKPATEIASNESAYIIYTSGSTGTPKGVVQSHKNVLHFISTYTRHLKICSNDKLTMFASYCFDAAMMDMFSAILNGATLSIFDLKNQNFTEISERLKKESITIYHSTPTVYRYFIDSLSNNELFDDIRLIVLGGEAVNKLDIDNYQRYFDDNCYFINLFGSTESSLSMLSIIDKNSVFARSSVPFCIPVDDTDIILMNDQQEESPIYGEVAIKSKYLALEYWQLPDLTKKVFIKDKDNNSIYLSGDTGRFLPDGSLLYCGRRDFQIKIRGFRIEMGEIESILAQHQKVLKCVVSASKDSDGEGEQQLFAFFNSTAGARVTSSELQSYLEKELPDYMIPSKIISVDSFPLTATGKVDRKRLIKDHTSVY